MVDQVLHELMGLERVGPDIFQSSPIIRCGARAPLCVLLTLVSMGCWLDARLNHLRSIL
jgi:hypothetical protein